MLYLIAILTVSMLLATATAQNINVPEPVPPPVAVRKSFNLDPFYEQWIDVGGLPVVASGRVNPYAVKEAAWLIRQMIGHRPDILQALAENNVRFAVMAYNELTTQIPEHSDLQPASYWDRRARGLGPTPIRPAVSCGEENLLNYPGDPYWNENILVHEFAHAIHQMGLNTVDPSFDKRLAVTFNAAKQKGLWRDTYAMTNKEEYWAEGTQSWFDTNRANDNEHNHVDTRDKLKKYDPSLAALLTEIFGDTNWRYMQAITRMHLLHLQGFNPEASPKFEWPPDLIELTELHQQLADPTNDGGGKWINLDEQDLSLLPNLKSQGDSIETTIIFVNSTETEITHHWVDYEGNEKFYGRIAPDTFVNLHTYAGHVWLIKDANARNLAVFRAADRTGRAIIATEQKDPNNDGDKWINLKELDLSSLPHLKSEGGAPETAIIFVNTTGSEISYYWVDYGGNEKFYGKVAPNASVNPHTFARHVWLIKNVNGRNLAVFRAGKKVGRAIITIKQAGAQKDVNKANPDRAGTQQDVNDVNKDGVVNILDLVQIANSFGQEAPDVNADGVVNLLDLVQVANAFTQ